MFSPSDVTWAKRGRAGLDPFCFTIQTIARAGESLRRKNRLKVTLAPIVTIIRSQKDIYLSRTQSNIYSLWILCPCQRNWGALLLPPVKTFVLSKCSEHKSTGSFRVWSLLLVLPGAGDVAQALCNPKGHQNPPEKQSHNTLKVENTTK